MTLTWLPNNNPPAFRPSSGLFHLTDALKETQLAQASRLLHAIRSMRGACGSLWLHDLLLSNVQKLAGTMTSCVCV